ncbi:hypothetical protein I552_3063 [Mycobacterium xenopi 3993]|nr:hypothetical protein I552_3063 [Mycobacterium xenopi 3993]
MRKPGTKKAAPSARADSAAAAWRDAAHPAGAHAPVSSRRQKSQVATT